MDFTQYNDVVQQWIQQIMQNRETNAELTLKYANDIIEYGQKSMIKFFLRPEVRSRKLQRMK